jgi:hypothetical protein
MRIGTLLTLMFIGFSVMGCIVEDGGGGGGGYHHWHHYGYHEGWRE